MLQQLTDLSTAGTTIGPMLSRDTLVVRQCTPTYQFCNIWATTIIINFAATWNNG